jgi:hypothetical protein
MEVFQVHPRCGLVFNNAQMVDAELRPLGKVLFPNYVPVDLTPDADATRFARCVRIKGCVMALASRFRPYLYPIPSGPILWGHDHWAAAVLTAIAEICFLDEALVLHRRHAVNAGRDFAGKGISYKMRMIGQRMALQNYLVEAAKWEQLGDYLESLQQRENGTFDPEQLAQVIRMARSLADLAQRRLNLRRMSRPARLPAATSMLLTGRYHRNAGSLLTYFKDLLA